MGMMARMRSLAPWFIIAVGGLFIVFMVLSDSKVADLVANRSNNVGSINGIDITYQDFSNLVEQYRSNRVAQTGQEIPEEQMETFRDQVWESIVSQKLVDEKIRDFGIEVSNEEIIETITGPNPPQVITQYFMDSTGQFNRAAYDEAITKPENKEAMIQTEEIVKQQLVQQKLASFLNASVIVSDADVKRKYVEQNVKMSADYVLIDVNKMSDSSIAYTEEDLKDYFNENKENYKIDAQRKLKYVLFSNKAIKDDSTSIKNNLEAIVTKLNGDTASFKTYVEIYSDKPYSIDTTSLSMLSGNISTIISNSKIGDIVGPALSNEGYVVYKLSNVIKSKETLARASHILIKTGTDAKAAKVKIDAIYKELSNGANFEEVAKRSSEDGSATKGGDLGWFGKGQMVKEFENASFNGKIDIIQKPIKSQFGYHIIKVTGKSNKKYVVEKIVNEIKASATTTDRAYNNANDFAYVAEKNSFTEEAELLQYNIQETTPFKEDARFIPGIGSSKALANFTFNNDVDDISSVFKVTAGYVVATISETIDAGYKPFEDVKESIKRTVIRNEKLKKAEEIAKEVKNKVGESGDFKIATSVFANAKIAKATDFTVSGTIPGVGRDYAFSQASLEAELNSVTDPVKANRGCYLLKVTQRTEIDSTMFNIQKNALRSSLLNQKKSRIFTDWVKGLKDEAEIVDNRFMFYK